MKWKDKKRKQYQHAPKTLQPDRLDAIRERGCCEKCWPYCGENGVSPLALSNAHFCDGCLEIIIAP